MDFILDNVLPYPAGHAPLSCHLWVSLSLSLSLSLFHLLCSYLQRAHVFKTHRFAYFFFSGMEND